MHVLKGKNFLLRYHKTHFIWFVITPSIPVLVIGENET